MPRFISRYRIAAPLCWALTALLPLPVLAAPIALPVSLDYAVVSDALSRQVFQGPEGRAELFRDNLDCNHLTLSDPQVSGAADGLLRLTTRVRARVGTPVAGRCLMPVAWNGSIETFKEALVAPGSGQVTFRVTDSNILSGDDGQRKMSGVAWNWVKNQVHPRLGAVSIDFGPTVSDLRALLRDALPAGQTEPGLNADSLNLQSAYAGPDALTVTFSVEAPTPPPDWVPAPEAALTPDELAAWDAAWQSWDAFATWLIKDLATPAEPELRATLAEILLETRHQLRDALAAESRAEDPVRGLFLSTWARLAPLLKSNALNLPAARSLELATFIGAADALQALDAAAPHLGLSLDKNTLRRMARMLVPTVTEEQLAYDSRVDPQLRQLLGLEPELELQPPEGTGEAGPFAWLIAPAEAAAVSPSLVKLLTGWIPEQNDLDRYLRAMEQLLDESIAAERKRGKVADDYFALYGNLVRATAWQESCWRQYVENKGEISPIQSSAGSVGLMQINQHVWRKIYDLDALQNNVGYNARAGNEILAHYLVDYALKRKEHEARGDIEDLARATYAVYNGGPSHLTRYRRDDTNAYLRGIDAAFWDKYQAIREQGADAVKQCYGG
ncbi:transglycosylase SLT domain-containing protein [Haliea sp. E1-2-M8]|uniref:transglycosylase SLT domain-containing protein n=1 Tax=Haliea sp. E1-2-M8 TaxID=3064706 RepID=UPI002726DA0A|nr:transglycosylase SLT domain-containing protein [Haliea sp. E1-2-M8]MDO8863587.1 transglycosylase SLT domain-containing protein [Haliea sp. E1-2-M8]